MKAQRYALALALSLLMMTGCGQSLGQISLQATEVLPSPTLASPTAAPATATPLPASPTPAPSATPLPATATPAPPTAVPEDLHDTAGLDQSSAPPTPEPTAASEQAHASEPQRMLIGSIGLDGVPIPVGLDESQVPIVPQHDIGWYNLSAMPGQGENVVFWGHVLRFTSAPDIPAPFARLKEAQLGDQIVVYTSDGREHRYQITQQVWVTPDQVEYILPQGREMLTLVSCIGDAVINGGSVVDMSHRLITIAEPLP